MELRKLTLTGISYSQTHTGAYALILTDESFPSSKLPIIIGAYEAQSIAVAIEKNEQPKRPMTHDLFHSFALLFGINVLKVVIHKLLDGVFYSTIYAVDKDDVERHIDSRTSDAVALAIRFSAPIYTYDTILDQAGIFFELDSDNHQEKEEQYPSEHMDEDEKHTPIDIEGFLQKLSKSPEPEINYRDLPLDELYSALEKAIKSEEYEKAAVIRDEISRHK